MPEPFRRVDLDAIRQAQVRIAGAVIQTPLVPSPTLSKLVGVPVHLKLEHRQITGSFKLRGATNAVRLVPADRRGNGVVAASTGNHGRALSHAAKVEGMTATICMSNLVPANKVEEIRRLGGNTRIIGQSQDEAQQEVDRLVAETGMVMIHPFDHPHVVAGQGSLGLEIASMFSEALTVLVPLSGGGLAAGVAAAVKGTNARSRVIGLTMDRGAAMHASLAAGRPVPVEEVSSLADSLGGGIGLHNQLTFSMCRDLLDGVILLTESEIAAGLRHAYAMEGEVVEGAGAVGIAALLAGRISARGPIVAILSGRNIDADVHRRLVSPAGAQN